VGACFAEGFGVAVEFGALDEDTDAGVACAEGCELFEGGQGALVEFVNSGDGIDFECVDEVVFAEILVRVAGHGLDELIEV